MTSFPNAQFGRLTESAEETAKFGGVFDSAIVYTRCLYYRGDPCFGVIEAALLQLLPIKAEPV